jgi:tetratricopeptide (TPR) repeat protein
VITGIFGGHRNSLRYLFSARALPCSLVWFLAALPLEADSIEAQIATHFGAGIEASRTGHFSRAVDEYKEVLRLDPTLAEARVNLGLAYHSLGEYKLAVTEFANALSEKPDIRGANLFLGIDYLKLGAAAKAVAPLEAVLQGQPSNREARRALAACYVDQEHYRLAQEQFAILSSLESDKAEALFVFGRGYLELAKHLADRMSRRYQNTSWAYRLAGDLLSDSSKWTDASGLSFMWGRPSP